MTLFEFIAAGENTVFSIALVLMLMISIIEGITSLLGMGISELLENVLPDYDFDLPTADAPQSTLTKLLGWINFGKVPVLIIFVCFLSAFGIIGYTLQYLIYGLSSHLLPWMISVPIALFTSLPFVRIFTNFIEKIMPKDESSALSEESFIGQIATITLGKASKGSPAEGKVTDIHGQTHYFMIQPESDDEYFQQGEQVLLLRPTSNGFYAIKNSNPSLQN